MNVISNILTNSPAAPYIAAAVVLGATALAGLRYCVSKHRAPDDLQTITKLAREIVALDLTIADADAYKFVATYKQSVRAYNTGSGNLAVMAAAARMIASRDKSGSISEDSKAKALLELGNNLLKTKSGQCDSMAAAVIAKVVEHIKNGGQWHSTLDIVGNGGHAFVIMNREGPLKDPSTWGSKAAMIDTWLAKLGVHEDFKHVLSAGDAGVVSDRRAILQNVRGFAPDQVTCTFTPADLRALAAAQKKQA
jgi:hypothetical protein